MANRKGERARSRDASKRGLFVAILAAACVQSLACQSPALDLPDEVIETASMRPKPASDFSGQKAWKHMRALNEIGARVSGTAGSERSRNYLKRALESMGIPVSETNTQIEDAAGHAVPLVHLTAEIAGRSSDVLLLGAHYDTSSTATEPPLRIDQNASGPALLLELARALAARPAPEYTIWLTWIDGDAQQLASESSTNRSTARMGSQSLVDAWSRGGQLARLRAAIVFGNIGDRDRPIVRDIDSPRIYRELFWEVARDLGYEEVFPADSEYGSTNTGRASFAQASLRSAVALQNSRESGAQPSADLASSASESKPRRPYAGFEAVGNVSLEVLVRTAAMLRKIDRFAEAPLRVGREESAEFTRAP